MPWMPTVNDMMGGTLLNPRSNFTYNATHSNYDSFDEIEDSLLYDSEEVPKEMNEKLYKIYAEALCDELQQQIKNAKSVIGVLKRR